MLKFSYPLKPMFLVALYVILAGYTQNSAAMDLSQQHQVDSMRALLPTQTEKEYKTTYDNILAILQQAENIWLYRNELDAFLSDAEKRGDTESQCVGRAYMITFYNNRGFTDSLLMVAPEYMEFVLKHDDWNAYSFIFGIYLTKLTIAKRYEEAFDEIHKMYEIAKAQGVTRGEGLALYWMGRINNNLHRFDDAMKNYKECLKVMEDLPIACIQMNLYPSYALVLRNLHLYDELLVLLQEFEEALAFANKDLEERGIQQRFISPEFKLHHEYIAVYLILDDLPNARKYYEKLKQSPMLRISESNQNLVDESYMKLLMAEGNFNEALAINDTLLQRYKSINEPAGITNTLYQRTTIARDLGDADEVFRSYFELNAVNDSIKRLDVNAQLDELRTKYEVDQLTAAKERNRNYLIFALVGCALLAITLAIWIAYSRRLQAKNRALYEQIQAGTQYRIANEETLISRSMDELSSEMILFRDLSLLMKEKLLFIDPEISRRGLSERLGTNERYLAEAIRVGSGETFNNYINQLRLNYSLTQLTTRTDLSIEAIAADSGFNSYTTYHRLFTRVFGMGPSDYRRLALRQ